MKWMFCFFLLANGCVAQQGPVEKVSETEQVVHTLVEAFNAHNAGKMGALVADDVLWLSVGNRDSLLVEADSKAALIDGMKGYFEAIPSVRSEMESVVVAGSIVAYRERVYWEGDNGEQTQAALGVYEVEDGLVQRVWYYPAVP